MRAIHMDGKRYGFWVVKKRVPPRYTANGSTAARVLAQCDCGTVREVVAIQLRLGLTRSCGCQKGNHNSVVLTRIRLSTGESIREAAQAHGIREWTIRGRINGMGMTPDDAVNAGPTMMGLTIGGRWRLLRDWLADIGISREGYRQRLNRGMTPEQAATMPRAWVSGKRRSVA